MTDPGSVDPSLAQQALDFLLPHLRSAAGKAVDKALEAAGKGVAAVYTAIRNKLAGAGKADALADVEQAPGDDDAVAALRLHLRKLLEADPAFRRELAALLPVQPSVAVTKQEAYADRGSTVTQIAGSNNKVGR